MTLAQQLYEGIDLGGEGAVGLITYMRTDSVQIAREAQEAARGLIGKRFGARVRAGGAARIPLARRAPRRRTRPSARPTSAATPEPSRGTSPRTSSRSTR